ncbi:hypothetical protein [Calycomorphotria hydatis]|uniref:Lipoprotein n=1 Tax=Calycomorphotria hydatis TaxID=2528027 RepID=A0A517TA51_9PLAN|nr:hypothetical protein [Calycomorphotria hydatis]QDT65243.1 hypothetical protein V22_24900 [Calycomorphotria hydatis]
MPLQARFSVAILLTVVCGTTGCGDQSYDLRMKVEPHDLFRTELYSSMRNGTVSLTGYQSSQGTANMTVSDVKERVILEAKNGTPHLILVSQMQDFLHMEMSIDGNQQEFPNEASPLSGRSVLFHWNGSSWESKLIGGQATEEQLATIEAAGNPWPEDYVMSGSLSVGDSWVVPAKRLQKMLGIEGDDLQGQMKLHFESILEHQEEECAFLSAQLDARWVMSDESGTPIQANMSVEGFIYRSLERRFDVESKLSGELTESMPLTLLDGSQVQMIIQGPVVITETTTKVRPRKI